MRDFPWDDLLAQKMKAPFFPPKEDNFDENYTNKVNESDASKIWNNEESFSILSNGENYLAIEKRQ